MCGNQKHDRKAERIDKSTKQPKNCHRWNHKQPNRSTTRLRIYNKTTRKLQLDITLRKQTASCG